MKTSVKEALWMLGSAFICMSISTLLQENRYYQFWGFHFKTWQELAFDIALWTVLTFVLARLLLFVSKLIAKTKMFERIKDFVGL